MIEMSSGQAPASRRMEADFFQRALRQHENSRRIFSRDLKIAALLLLIFQFVVFFQFIELNDDKVLADWEIAHLKENKKGLQEVKNKFEAMNQTFEVDGEQLAAALKTAKSELKEKLGSLEKFISTLRDMDKERRRRIQINKILSQDGLPFTGSPATDEALSDLVNLSYAQRQILKTLKIKDRGYKKLVKRLVNKQLVPPILAKLNSGKNELIQKQLQDKKYQMLDLIENQRTFLEKHSIDVSSLEDKVYILQENIYALQINLPDIDDWWTVSKNRNPNSRFLPVDIDECVDKFGNALGNVNKDLKLVGFELSPVIGILDKKVEKLNSQLAELQKRADLINLKYDSYTKPILGIIIDPKTAILFYPVILAIIFIFFVWRYLELRQRARYLNAVSRKLGLNDDISQLYFSDFMGVTRVTREEKSLGGFLLSIGPVSVLCAESGVFAVMSMFSILKSPTLNPDSPVFLYVASGICLVVTYALLITTVFRPPKTYRL